jgi:HlyD family secretion protein
MNKKWLIIIGAIALAAVAGFFGYQRISSSRQAAAEEPTLQTATVSQGDIVLTASGSGNLLPATEVDLSFGTSGTLLELKVEVGDKVEAGEELARLDDAEAQANVTQAEINLRQAERDLADLTAEVDAVDLAEAQANLASAQADLNDLTTPPTAEELAAARETLASAQENLNTLLAGPDPQEVEEAEMALEQAKNSLWAAQMSRDATQTNSARKQAEIQVANAEMSVRKAEMNYEEVLAGPTTEEIAAARTQVVNAQEQLDDLEEGATPAELAVAKANVAQAQEQLDELLAGASSEDVEVAQLTVEQARNQLASAQTDLESVVLKAPFAGIVTAVSAEVGETAVGESSIITLADMENPLVRFWVEESDLSSVAVGNPVNITFEALPDYTFSGEIIRVEPTLVTVSNMSAIQIWASIDLPDQPITLLSGMTADVEAIAGEARNALLVPVEALRELSAGQYAVFVVKSDGELELRPVEVGLQDYVNAEILSGLELGEVVSVSVETSTETTGVQTGTQQQMMPPEGGMGPMMGP